MKALLLASLVTFSALPGCCTTGAKIPVNDEERIDRLQVREPRFSPQE